MLSDRPARLQSVRRTSVPGLLRRPLSYCAIPLTCDAPLPDRAHLRWPFDRVTARIPPSPHNHDQRRATCNNFPRQRRNESPRFAERRLKMSRSIRTFAQLLAAIAITLAIAPAP